jgi:hypothetical protein
MSKELAIEAKGKIDHALSLLKQANAALRACTDDDLRFAELHWQYVLIACGDPRGGQGTKPIFDSHADERVKARAQVGAVNAQNYSPYYRAELRQVLRTKKMPEPMIWERWPALTEAEKAEKATREDAWYSRHSRVKRAGITQVADPWTNFLKRKAIAAAKRSGRSWTQIMQDKSFVQRTKAYYDSLDNLDLGI